MVNEQLARTFSPNEHETWKTVFTQHQVTRENKIFKLFDQGVSTLQLKPDQIPDLAHVNSILKPISGFQGLLVDGLEDGASFYQLLAERYFPVGNFIRSNDDIGYTPEPDIIHDLYGHLPFFVDKDYADFCQKFGETAVRYSKHPELFRQFERFFWFTIEFGMIETEHGLKVFGAGIASSLGECEYSLGPTPKLEAFDLDTIRHQEFRIDIMQPTLFVLKNTKQLFSSLETLENKIRSSL